MEPTLSACIDAARVRIMVALAFGSRRAKKNINWNAMKKIALILLVAAVLSGCAAQPFKNARANANLVKNGMTLAEATEILGMPPTHIDGDVAQWRRGNAQTYTGTAAGAIEFHLENGRIVDIPDGGIFGPAALEKVNKAWLKRYEAAHAEEEAKLAAEKAEKDRLDALSRKEREEKARLDAQARKEQEEKDRAQRLKEIAAELEAERKSTVTCKDSITCKKVFALAQIYVQQHSDQKIQVATDTIIETYNPTEDGKIAMVITKIPSAGTLEMVKITPSCQDKSGYFESLCRLKRTNIYRGFKPFIEKSLSM
jgi:hypothetical protein